MTDIATVLNYAAALILTLALIVIVGVLMDTYAPVNIPISAQAPVCPDYGTHYSSCEAL